MKIFFLNAFAMIVLCGCATTPARFAGEHVFSKPLGYSSITHYLESRVQSETAMLTSYQRDSDGSKLFINFYFRKGNEAAHRTLIITGEGIREIPSYPHVWYDDQENPVFRLEGGREWYENEGRSSRFFSKWDEAGYIFKNGDVIPRKTARVAGVLGGDCVLVQFKRESRQPQQAPIRGPTNVTIEYPNKIPWILSKPENPRQPLFELPNDFEPQAAYASGSRLILFDTYRPQGDKFVRRCLIYEQSGDSYRLAEEIPIPWMGGVFDFNARSGDVLIEALNKRHKYATYYRFNINTKQRTLLGLVPADNVLFLKEDVTRILDAAMGESK